MREVQCSLGCGFHTMLQKVCQIEPVGVGGVLQGKQGKPVVVLLLSEIVRVGVELFLALHLGSVGEVVAINRHLIEYGAIGICAVDVASITFLEVDVLTPIDAAIFLEASVKVEELAIGRNHPDSFLLPLGRLAMGSAVLFITTEDMDLVDLFYLSIVQHTSNVLENVQGDFWCDVEEFPVITDTEVCEPLDVSVYQLLSLIVLDSLQRCIDFERKGYRGIIQFL